MPVSVLSDAPGIVGGWPLNEGAGPGSANIFAVSPNLSVTNYLLSRQGTFASSNAQPAWTSVGNTVSITDNAATDPDGGVTASIWTALAGNNYIWQTFLGSFSLPPGTYTVSIYLRSRTGGNQNFRLSWQTAGLTDGPLQSVGVGWTRISLTFIASATITGLYIRNDGASAVDAEIWGFQCELANSVSAYQRAKGDLVIAPRSQGAAWSTRGVTLTGSRAYLEALFSSAKVYSQCSIYAAVRQNATQQYAPIFSQPDNSNSLTLQGQDALTVASVTFGFGGQKLVSSNGSIVGNGFTVLSGVCDGTNLTIRQDGTEIAQLGYTGVNKTLSRFFAGNLNTVIPLNGEIAYLALYDTGHDVATNRDVSSLIRSLITGRTGISLSDSSKLLVWEGDSITEAPGLSGYRRQTVVSIGGPVACRSYATSGNGIANLESRAASVKALKWSGVSKPVLFVLIGRNDLQSIGVDTYFTRVKNYCLDMMNAGFHIILATLLPSTAAGYNTARNSWNSLVYADTSFYHVLCDFASDPVMGPDAAAAGANYSDGTHPTQNGQNILAALTTAAVNAAFVGNFGVSSPILISSRRFRNRSILRR